MKSTSKAALMGAIGLAGIATCSEIAEARCSIPRYKLIFQNESQSVEGRLTDASDCHFSYEGGGAVALEKIENTKPESGSLLKVNNSLFVYKPDPNYKKPIHFTVTFYATSFGRPGSSTVNFTINPPSP